MKTLRYLLVFSICIALTQCGRTGGHRGGGGSRPRTTSRPRYTHGTTRRSSGTTPRYNTGTTPRYNAGTTPRHTTARPTGTTRRVPTTASWSLPPRPGQAVPTGNQPQQIKIVNKYNYNYPGYYSLPVASSHPGYFYTPSTYHYSSSDTGSTAFGFFLGYSLAKLTTPTYSHQSFYNGYTPRYDHYTVHHYYHNKDSVPQNQQIQANTIVGCVGDTISVCPANTTSLCTSSGTLMCVVAATSTVPCLHNAQVNCVKSTINCTTNNNAPECKNANSTTISIPCVSTAQVQGDLRVVNSTFVTSNSTNSTSTSTTTPEPTTSTKYPITTIPTVLPNRRKRDVTQSFCVTVLAVPAAKQTTEGELFYKDAQSVLSKFFETAWSL